MKLNFITCQKDIVDWLVKNITYFAVAPFGGKDIPVHEARKRRAKALEWTSHQLRNNFIDNLTLQDLKVHSNREQMMLTQLGYSQPDMNMMMISRMVNELTEKMDIIEESLNLMKNSTEMSIMLLRSISDKCALIMDKESYKSLLHPLVERLCKSKLSKYISNVRRYRADLSDIFVQNLFKYGYYDALEPLTKIHLWNKSTIALHKELEFIIESIFSDVELNNTNLMDKTILDNIVNCCMRYPHTYYYIMDFMKSLLLRSFHNNLIQVIHCITLKLAKGIANQTILSYSLKTYFPTHIWPILPTLTQEPQENFYHSLVTFIESCNDKHCKFMTWFAFIQFYNWYQYAIDNQKLSQNESLKRFIDWIERPNMQ